jgi:Lon-like ATP-dependent protease
MRRYTGNRSDVWKFISGLTRDEISKIAKNAAYRGGFRAEEGIEHIVSKYAQNGRDAVNIIQIAGGVALTEGRSVITKKDIEWVVEFGHYSPRLEKKICAGEFVGCINGLAVHGDSMGMVIDIEVSAIKATRDKGTLKVTGIIEEEEMDGRGHKLKRTSSAKASIDNVMTVLKRFLNIDCSQYDIHLNFPGGVPIDGPSAGIAIATAIYSAINNVPISSDIAMTGELSIRGKVKPVGGVVAKVESARVAGVKKVLIPKDNWQELFNDMEIEVIPVEEIEQVIDVAFARREAVVEDIPVQNPALNILSAQA